MQSCGNRGAHCKSTPAAQRKVKVYPEEPEKSNRNNYLIFGDGWIHIIAV